MTKRLKLWTQESLMILLLMLLTALMPGCATNRKIVFVSESVTVEGKPEVVLQLTESVEANAAYYDGKDWIEVEDTEIPAGWLVVSRRVLKMGGKK